MKQFGFIIRTFTIVIAIAFAAILMKGERAGTRATPGTVVKDNNEPCAVVRTCHFFMGYL